MKQQCLTHEFVELMPNQLREGVIYVSMEYATAIHQCACGCGEKVVTPISPTDWTLQFDGDTISLNPSIGNWNFVCRSHYWIKRGVVRWAGDMPRRAIEEGRAHDRQNKARYFAGTKLLSEISVEATIKQEDALRKQPPHGSTSRGNFWSRMKGWRAK